MMSFDEWIDHIEIDTDNHSPEDLIKMYHKYLDECAVYSTYCNGNDIIGHS